MRRSTAQTLLHALLLGATLAGTLLLAPPVAHVARAAAAPAVPTVYQSLYTAMQTSLSTFSAMLPAGAPTTNTPIYGASLQTANGMQGSTLLTNKYEMNGVDNELTRLQALGVQGVTVEIPYPLLLPSFPQSAQYLQFFSSVAQHVKQKGMKLVVEQGVSVPGSNAAFPRFSYPSYCTYEQQEQQIMQIMIDNLAPSYMTVLDEPWSQYQNTHYAQFNPSSPQNAVAYVKYLLGDAADTSCPSNAVTPLRKGATLIGAGQGNWDTTRYAQGYAQIPNLDAIDLHIYPLVQTTYQPFLHNILTVANYAKASGKKIGITEMWDTKTLPGESGTSYVGQTLNIDKRDVFSFWQPIDAQFLTEISQFAKTNPVLYLSPFWSLYFESYLTYTPGVADQNTPAAALYAQVQRLQAQNMTAGGPFTQTALAYKSVIAMR